MLKSVQYPTSNVGGEDSTVSPTTTKPVSNNPTTKPSNKDGEDNSGIIAVVVVLAIVAIIVVVVVSRKKYNEAVNHTQTNNTAGELSKPGVANYCTKCGQALPNDSAFCHRCGTKVFKEDDAQ